MIVTPSRTMHDTKGGEWYKAEDSQPGGTPNVTLASGTGERVVKTRPFAAVPTNVTYPGVGKMEGMAETWVTCASNIGLYVLVARWLDTMPPTTAVTEVLKM